MCAVTTALALKDGPSFSFSLCVCVLPENCRLLYTDIHQRRVIVVVLGGRKAAKKRFWSGFAYMQAPYVALFLLAPLHPCISFLLGGKIEAQECKGKICVPSAQVRFRVLVPLVLKNKIWPSLLRGCCPVTFAFTAYCIAIKLGCACTTHRS